MTVRGFVAVWTAAALLVAGFFIGLSVLRQPAHGMAPVVVIGTSLIRHGVSPEMPVGGLLGDGRAHVIISRNAMSEGQAIRALRIALAEGAETILLEINPFTFDFAFQASTPPITPILGFADDLRTWSSEMKRLLRNGGQEVPAEIDRPFTLDPASLARTYPLRPRPPRREAALRKVIARAKAQHTEIILLLPPRSHAAAVLIGPGTETALRDQQTGLARSLGLAIVPMAPIWPDDHFTDNAHLNRRGRARFMAELRTWWESRP